MTAGKCSRSGVLLTTLSAAICLASCQIAEPGQYHSVAVWSVVVDSLGTGFDGEPPLVLDSAVWARPSRSDFDAVGASNAQLRAYHWANQPPQPLSPSDADSLGIPFFHADGLPASGNRAWWAAVQEVYGDVATLLSFSQPGFSPDGLSAVFHYEIRCEGFCAEAHVVRVDWIGEQWVLAADYWYLVS